MEEGQSLPIAAPTRTRAIMAAHGLTFKKSLGQNFLTDINVLTKIVNAAAVSADDDVIEIGPGIGALTEQLAQRAHHVVAVEIDQRLIPVLADTLAPYKNVTVVNADILKTDVAALVTTHLDGHHPVKVVANLPYYITTPIIMRLLAAPVSFAAITVMMQREVAARLEAQPGTKDYGSLSVAVQFAMHAHVAFIVPRTVFVPQPNVDSAIVVLTPATAPAVTDRLAFTRLVKGAFMHRRKSLWNNLVALYGKKNKEQLRNALQEAQIDAGVRAEQLTVADFVRLSNALIVALADFF